MLREGIHCLKGMVFLPIMINIEYIISLSYDPFAYELDATLGIFSSTLISLVVMEYITSC